ncbi:hypothetical protein SCLCIDRAFT_1216515 [Scleroderma citrinum Foug A]|uniref:Uncharacterized protein n=1 Tax=Scleroderma citrinum Foug A TaxID=1036808 RepID=A0A0C3DY27_9AGAM|nr:hypothetical protein SCLCIDRAFT_1216515 [Scleroderma citrinum Foug A]
MANAGNEVCKVVCDQRDQYGCQQRCDQEAAIESRSVRKMKGEIVCIPLSNRNE